MGILGVVLAVAIISIHASDVTGKTKCSLSFFTLFQVFNSGYYSTKIIELKSKNKTYYYCSEKNFFFNPFKLSFKYRSKFRSPIER